MKKLNAKTLVWPSISVVLGLTAMALAQSKQPVAPTEPLVWDIRALSSEENNFEAKQNKLLADGWEPFSIYSSKFHLENNHTTMQDGQPIYKNYTDLSQSGLTAVFKKRVPLSAVKARLEVDAK